MKLRMNRIKNNHGELLDLIELYESQKVSSYNKYSNNELSNYIIIWISDVALRLILLNNFHSRVI